MKTAQDIILRPIVTEESMKNMQQKKYTFRVAMDATKIEIAQAAEALFGVEVAKVNTMHMNGKGRRMGANFGYQPGLEKGHHHLDGKVQGHRVLRQHDVIPLPAALQPPENAV